METSDCCNKSGFNVVSGEMPLAYLLFTEGYLSLQIVKIFEYSLYVLRAIGAFSSIGVYPRAKL